ncbi:hypothetical protein J2S74_004920 [Evansella vedderi]|uniref:Uncharacterized protein n=1 Tax=Evansella vedderi TaxID=38282 RepID=A0ABU0A1U6_9BACI|nr:hypothetical protein [Evansella vedderi]MDQ0257462.1 hypothetical protein [Evansella vedderi]
MKLMQVLLSQPQKELVKRIKNIGITCNLHSKQQVTEELTNFLLDSERVEENWGALGEIERDLLLHMCYSPSIMAVSPYELHTYLKREDRDSFQIVLESLMDKGWIYQDDANSLILPQELREYIHQIYINGWIEHSIYIPLKDELSYDIIQDLFEMMDFIDSKKIPLTKNQTIYKKDLTNILQLLSKKEELPTEQWRFGYGRHYNVYPDYFSLLYDFSYDQGWLEEGESLLTTKNWETGQELHMNELLDRLLRFYIRLYRRPIPQLPFIIELFKRILSRGDAIEKCQLIERIKDFVDPYYYDKPPVIVEKRIINMLCYIHFLSSTEIDGCEYIFLHPRYQ